ncbi:MAG: 50S ribosomal protein L23 [Flavobacteriales bacterium]|nr:50S ribosomal protein L23 [Flavobacteriales bacterium]
MSQILIRPIITEKMTAQGEKENRYGFVVARDSNKLQIRDAVKKQYGVEVDSVRTMIVRGKRRTRYTKTNILHGSSASYKKAIVTLKAGETIDLYSSI